MDGSRCARTCGTTRSSSTTRRPGRSELAARRARVRRRGRERAGGCTATASSRRCATPDVVLCRSPRSARRSTPWPNSPRSPPSGPRSATSTVVSIGGGITQDVTGFLASTLYRGVRWVYVPTTLLAHGRQLHRRQDVPQPRRAQEPPRHRVPAGAHRRPRAVRRHARGGDYLSGLGEVVKLHLLGGEEPLRRLRDDLTALLRAGRRPRSVATIRASLRDQARATSRRTSSTAGAATC